MTNARSTPGPVEQLELAGAEGLLTVVIDAGNVEVVPVDALEGEGAVADRAAVDAAYRGCRLGQE